MQHVTPASRAEWRQWLAENHADATGVWLIYYKKGTGKPSVTYDEAVEEALCFGWIDSVPNKLDDERYKQLFSPRNPRSGWSRVNKERLERLTAAGMMAPAGLTAVEIAKQNGAWTKLDAVENLEMPDDLQAAFAAAEAVALQNFTAFARSTKRGILEWLNNAKRPETRQKRIEQIVSMAAQNKRAQFDK